MKEDLIERLTSMVFGDDDFSNVVLKLCAETVSDQEEKYTQRLREIEGLRPVHVGIDQYLTLDSSSNIEQIFMESKKPAEESGDVGGSEPHLSENPERKDSDWQFINII
jgi:hypothetical protein